MKNDELMSALAEAFAEATGGFDDAGNRESVIAVLTRLRDLGPSEEMAEAFYAAFYVDHSATDGIEAALTSLLGDRP